MIIKGIHPYKEIKVQVGEFTCTFACKLYPISQLPKLRQKYIALSDLDNNEKVKALQKSMEESVDVNEVDYVTELTKIVEEVEQDNLNFLREQIIYFKDITLLDDLGNETFIADTRINTNSNILTEICNILFEDLTIVREIKPLIEATILGSIKDDEVKN